MKRTQKILDFAISDLKKTNSFHTLNEINQQPEVWKKICNLVREQEKAITKFIDSNITKQAKIILTGAGTSEFVGTALYRHFVQKGYDVVSISTTTITANPLEHISVNGEIILISFARSGNSPESVATYNLVKKINKKVKNIIITCNKEGELAKKASQNKKCLLFVLPEEANDKSFAMTSSFTGMFVAAFLILNIKNLNKCIAEIINCSISFENNILKHFNKIEAISNYEFERIVFLGSGNLEAFSQESHLKFLELTAGKIPSFFSSPLAFRHGPKSILDSKTVVVVMLNKDTHSRQYELDFINELISEKQIKHLVLLDHKFDLNLFSENKLYLDFDSDCHKTLLGLNYILFAQILAFYKSRSLKLSPDNPWPSGLVNRVVVGVKIHKFRK